MMTGISNRLIITVSIRDAYSTMAHEGNVSRPMVCNVREMGQNYFYATVEITINKIWYVHAIVEERGTIYHNIIRESQRGAEVKGKWTPQERKKSCVIQSGILIAIINF